LYPGFIGTHVVEAFLTAGYKVRGTARSVAKISTLQAMWDKKYGAGAFEVVIVEDFANPGAFDDAIKGRVYWDRSTIFPFWINIK
jgi:uncharacterized protein YbjT (DUF2867 family)